MAVGFAPEEEEDVAGPNPANAAPPVPATAGVPAGQAPEAAPPVDPGDQLATPEGAASPSTMAPPEPVVPERPKRPDLTGDLQQDLKNNLLYTRSLEDWHDAQQAANATKANDLNTEASRRQLEEDQRQQKERDALREQQKQERASRQADIDAAVREKMQAQQARPQPSALGRIGAAFSVLAGGLGAGLSAAGGHPTANLAVEQFNKQQDREYEQLKQRRLEANDAVLQARYGYKDSLDNQRAALNDLDADFSARHKILADQAAYELKRNGLSPEQIQANELVAGNLEKSAAYEGNIHMREMEAQRKNEDEERKKTLDVSTIAKNNAEAASASALADYRKGRTHKPGTGGGAGSSKAIDAMNAVAKSGGSVGDIEEAGVSAGMARKEALAQAKAMIAGHGKGGGGGGGDQALVVRDVEGTPIGLAPSTRNVKQLEDRAVNYDQAIKSLKDILASGNLVPRGAKFDNAVLAIASTTTAGSTDANVAHEAGTLKNAVGLLDADAIREKIGDLERRQAQFKKTLRPLPTGFKVDQGDAVASAPKEIPKATIDRAKGVYDDPGATVDEKRAASKILHAAGVI